MDKLKTYLKLLKDGLSDSAIIDEIPIDLIMDEITNTVTDNWLNGGLALDSKQLNQCFNRALIKLINSN